MPMWDGTSENGISAPIGIKGTGNPMELSLGLDPTKVNTLIAGTTGSGKSNLLHVIIMSFALKYSPEELIFYLIDFKEAEFSRYTNLPHVEVLGVESDSEYGLAILTKLVNEKDSRMHKFREAGVNKISSYRLNHPRDLFPRIMVIFDEYQRLLEDERIKSEALMKIEDLARTGRAAGIHLILSTQTISPGLLNNATMGQFRMRIGLRCTSRDDSERIIGNNGAADLGKKTGFAIYTDNPAGGVQYNNEFMVAMAPSVADYNRYIVMMNDSPKLKNYNKRPRVFRGFEPVKFDDYKELFLISDKEDSESIHAWLGEPIKIASPLAAEFNYRLGDNLAIITDDVRDAYGMILSSLLSILTQSKETRIHLLDSGVKPQYSSILSRIAKEYPDNVFLTNQDALSDSFRGIADQSSQRPSQDSSMIFVIIVGLQKFLTLRAPEEYLQHSYEDRQSLNQYLIRILKEGPERGIHTIVWCDTYKAFKLYFPNQGRGIRDYFNFKVAGTMDYEDSNNFIQDSIAIKKINRPHRAIYYSNGVYTLFRPFDADYK